MPNTSLALKPSEDIPRLFLDPNFTPSNPQTFSQLFPFLTEHSMSQSGGHGDVSDSQKQNRDDTMYDNASRKLVDLNSFSGQVRIFNYWGVGSGI